MIDGSERLQSARRLNGAGRHSEALEAALEAVRQRPDDAESKRLAARLLARHPSLAGPGWREAVASLIVDPAIDPMAVSPSGWNLALASGGGLRQAGGDDGSALARSIEDDPFILTLLEQTYVTRLDVEHILTRLRRWLLLSGASGGFPRLVAALAAQAAHNGGAWLFDEEERALVDAHPQSAIALAYRPPRAAAVSAPLEDPISDAVANMYRHWPYPAWTRVTVPRATTVPEEVAAVDGGRPSGLPVRARLLVAGCGTGREAALAAHRFPDARITAIDISEASIAYAAERCRTGPPAAIDFRAMDLHRVADLGDRFHFIACSGVLHHLPDPEAGWAALAGVLEPGGVMRVMLYSRLARQDFHAARDRLADLAGCPIDDDVLREARRRLIQGSAGVIEASLDFYTLAGIHDLLFHPREDCFDVSRIARALDRLGLELLAFDLPSPAHRARYRWEHPDDPDRRDVEAWAAIERDDPLLFRSMHRFWCRKRRAP